MVAIKNFAVGTVAVGGAPSPATSGTSLTLTTGHGARFLQPSTDGPFYASAFPPGVLPSFANAEIVQVTARSTDTITIVRGQRTSTAQSIGAGWVISNSIFTEDLFTSSINAPEVLSGTPNGVLTTFTLSQAYTQLWLFKNGVFMQPGSGNDYTLSGTTVTMLDAPDTGTLLVAIGITGSQVMISGSNSLITSETPTGLVNGSNALFTVTKASYVGGTLEVYVNGVKQKGGSVHYTETNPGIGTFTLGDAPLTGDDIMVNYQWTNSVTGNADTVDGYHANATPTANMVPVLDANAKLPSSATPIPTSYYLVNNSAINIPSTTQVAISGLSQVVAESGKYLLGLTGNMQVNTAPSNPRIGIYINGTRIAYAAPSTNTGVQQTYSVLVQATLTAGDTVTAQVINGNCQLYEGQHLTITGIK